MADTGLSPREGEGPETTGPSRSDPLDSFLRRAGATIIEHDGVLVAEDFGSVAGEVALGQRAVGVADRSELAKWQLSGRPEQLDSMVGLFTGARREPAVAVHAAGGWWCTLAPDRLLVIAEPRERAGMSNRLNAASDIGVSEVSARYTAIAVVGPRAGVLLRAAGMPGSDPVPDELRSLEVGGHPAHVLSEGPESFLVLVGEADAVPTWEALLEVGHALGVGLVGRQALERLAISARTRARQGY
ncbi:MAG: hypothetical protein H0U84_05865 [Thermoleophilaceae bacterium]|nr:hypothetical protein [Thermoleophilaceae bacterium]